MDGAATTSSATGALRPAPGLELELELELGPGLTLAPIDLQTT